MRVRSRCRCELWLLCVCSPCVCSVPATWIVSTRWLRGCALSSPARLPWSVRLRRIGTAIAAEYDRLSFCAAVLCAGLFVQQVRGGTIGCWRRRRRGQDRAVARMQVLHVRPAAMRSECVTMSGCVVVAAAPDVRTRRRTEARSSICARSARPCATAPPRCGDVLIPQSSTLRLLQCQKLHWKLKAAPHKNECKKA